MTKAAKQRVSGAAIRERAELLTRFMGFSRRRGRQKKPLIPELMEHFRVSRSTIERALRPRKSAPSGGVRRDVVAQAHAAAARSGTPIVDIDAQLRSTLGAWLGRSTRRTPQTIALAKALLEALS